MGIKNMKQRTVELIRDEEGVAALEFGLFAPILFFACLATVDLGMALNERMTIDHVLRAGANFAMADPGESEVREVMEAVAKENFTVTQIAPGGNQSLIPSSGSIYFEVDKFFACPDQPSVAVADPADCGSDYYTFYRVDAVKTYAAMILPDISFNPAMQVQVR